MGTLLTAMSAVRLRIKDPYKTEFSDADLLVLVNDALQQIHSELKRIESTLIIEEGSISCIIGEQNYTFADSFNIVEDSVYIDDQLYPLTQVSTLQATETDAQPTEYRLMPDGSISVWPTPDEEYLINLQYFAELTEPTDSDYLTYDFPWLGIWNQAITSMTALAALVILERSLGPLAIQSEQDWVSAMQKTYNRGRIRRVAKGNLYNDI